MVGFEYIMLLLFGISLRYLIFSHSSTEKLRDLSIAALRSIKGTKVDQFLDNMYNCPFCNGFWAGLAVYLLYFLSVPSYTVAFLFSISVGYVALLIEEKRKLDDTRYEWLLQQQDRLDNLSNL